MQVNGYRWCSVTNILFLCFVFKMIVFIFGWTTTLTQKYYLGHLFRQMTASGLIQIFWVCGQSLFICNVKYAKILPDVIYSTLITVYLDTILHSVHLSQEKTNRLDSLEIYLASINSSFLKKSITQQGTETHLYTARIHLGSGKRCFIFGTMHQKTMLCSREGAPKVLLVSSSLPQARREQGMWILWTESQSLCLWRTWSKSFCGKQGKGTLNEIPAG